MHTAGVPLFGWAVLRVVASPWTLRTSCGRRTARCFLCCDRHTRTCPYCRLLQAEADADFISALAGLRATDSFARYAVALRLWRSAVAQLPLEAQKRYYEQLPNRAKRDLEAMAKPYERYQPPRFIATIQRRSYDHYLKTQRCRSRSCRLFAHHQPAYKSAEEGDCCETSASTEE